MILDKKGQSFSAGGKLFAVGGTAWCPWERDGELFCIIRAIRAEDNETPTAQCCQPVRSRGNGKAVRALLHL